jgi:hypothetical protein
VSANPSAVQQLEVTIGRQLTYLARKKAAEAESLFADVAASIAHALLRAEE